MVVGEWVVLEQVVVQVVTLSVLASGDAGGEQGLWFEGEVDHHLEHVDGVVLDAVALEVHSLLVVVHLHVSAGHLDHAVVDGFVGVLQGLEVGVLDGKGASRGLEGLISGSDVNEESHMDGGWEPGGFGQYGKSVGERSNFILRLLILSNQGFVILKGEGWIKGSNLESSGVSTNEIERFVQDSWLFSIDRKESLSNINHLFVVRFYSLA